MPTINLELTTAWLKVADTADTAVSLELTTGMPWEIAATDADAPTDIIGHLVCDERITRPDIGAGHLFARTRAGRETLVVTK